jgi:oxygen-independent coproporphyrinogen-3 oxidase
MQSWLALGPTASGTIVFGDTGTGLRYTYPPDADNWLESEKERLDALTLIKETFLMGFRFVEGPDAGSFLRRFKKTINETIPKTLSAWRGRGRDRGHRLLCEEKCALTKEGLLFLNKFLLDAFEELDLSFPKWYNKIERSFRHEQSRYIKRNGKQSQKGF